MYCRSWILLLSLICVLQLHGLVRNIKVNAAELEGFGDEFDDDEDAIDQLYPEITLPQNTASLDAEKSNADADSQNEAASGVDVVSSTWDDEEFEGVHMEKDNDVVTIEPDVKNQSEVKNNLPRALKSKEIGGPFKYLVEISAVVFLLFFALNYWLGRKTNESLALAWAEKFAVENSIFEKNFSLLGVGDGVDEPLIVKDTQDTFKFYATGRRYCEGLLATMSLKNRHDLLSVLSERLFPKQDQISVEVYMNEDSMDPFVLAVTKRKAVKSMQRENKDLKELCNLVDFSGKKRWPVEELAVLSDSKEAASELLSDFIIDQLFADKLFQKMVSPFFVSLHFTDQFPLGAHKKVLRFKFLLPPASRMVDITRLMACVPHFIDAVGRFRLSSAARTKAEATREKWLEEETKELKEQRLEAALKRREEKRRAEEARLTPAELARRQEKERTKAMKKAMPRVKLSKGH